MKSKEFNSQVKLDKLSLEEIHKLDDLNIEKFSMFGEINLLSLVINQMVIYITSSILNAQKNLMVVIFLFHLLTRRI